MVQPQEKSCLDIKGKRRVTQACQMKKNEKLSFKPKDCSNHLSEEEMSNAEEAILYFVQTQAVTNEMRILEKSQNVKRVSKLGRLDSIYERTLIDLFGLKDAFKGQTCLQKVYILPSYRKTIMFQFSF